MQRFFSYSYPLPIATNGRTNRDLSVMANKHKNSFVFCISAQTLYLMANETLKHSSMVYKKFSQLIFTKVKFSSLERQRKKKLNINKFLVVRRGLFLLNT